MAKKPAASETEGKKSKKNLVVVALVVLVAVVAGGAYLKMGKKAAAAGPPQPGIILPLSQLTINLADGHYLQVSPSLQLVKGQKGKKETADTSEVLDTVISVFSGDTMSQLSGPAGLAAAKKSLLTALDKEFPGQLYAVYFTNFVMQ